MPAARSFTRATATVARRVAIESRSAAHAWRAGMFRLESPRRTRKVLRALDRLGQLGAAIRIAALRYGDRIGVIDELGALTFGDLDERSSALASALRARGVGAEGCVGI